MSDLAVPAPLLVVFARGVLAILKSWAVLKLAVQESWGGPHSEEKRTWIASNIVDAFEVHPLDADDLEDLLLEAMADEFEVQIEDGSTRQIATAVMQAWRAAQESDLGHIATLEERASQHEKTSVTYSRGSGSNQDDDDESESSGSGEDAPQAPEDASHYRTDTSNPRPKVATPGIDEDGFQTVGKGKRSQRH